MAGTWNQMGSQIGELFRRELAVLVKLDDKEQKQQRVGISVCMNEITSPMHAKELTVRLTDDLDPFFLFSLTLSEDDFLGLKAQQGLLVDFHSFPQKFIELLKLCITESTLDSPKFHLQLAMYSSDRGSALLNVVEANPFKHLTHLSLKLLHANDSVLKKYLAECLVALREENAQVMQTSAAVKADLSTKLARSQELLDHRTKELDQIKLEWNSQTSSLSSRHAREVEVERERALNAQTEAAQRYEADKKALVQSYEDKLHQLESKLLLAESSNQDLREAKYKMEAAASELRSKVTVSEEDLSSLRQEVQRLRQENRLLESRAHELEKSLHSLTTRTAVQEQEIKDKEEVIAKMNELLELANQQKFKAEAALDQKQKQVAKLDVALKTASQEVMKGNEIIQKMQSELRRYQEKVKLKNVAVTQQEKLLGEKDSALAHLRQELQSQSQALTEKEEQLRKLEEALEASNQELEKSKEVLKTNENVINWLNKQVNSQAMSQGVALSSSAPNLAVKHGVPPAPSVASLPGVTSLHRPQFTSTPAGAGVRQAFGSLTNQQNVQQVMYRGVKKSPLSSAGTAQQQTHPKVALQRDSPKGSQHGGGGGGGVENVPAFLPGKYIAPEVPPPSEPAPKGGGAGGGVTAPTRATHQYLAGMSPLVTPALSSKAAGAK